MNTPAPLLALGVVHPALLAGLGLIAIPIIIHFLSRRRHRIVRWGAMRFLLEAEKKNRRRLRFEQLLLLALRCLAILLLVLMIARPFVRPGLVAAMLGAAGQAHRVILIDDSASLGYRVGLETDFDRLAAAALRLLTWLEQESAGDLLSVYLTSRPDVPLVNAVRLGGENLDTLRTQLDELKASHVPGNPRTAFGQIAQVLAAERGRTRADIYILSDFQNSDWIAAAQAAQSVFAPLAALETAEPRAVLISADRQPRPNLAVTDVRFERPQTIEGIPTVVRATLVNHSAQPRRNVQLHVTVDGAALPIEPLDVIPAGARRSISFEATFPEHGFREVHVGIATVDHFAVDDIRRAGVHVVKALRVLMVNGAPSLDPFADEVYLLRNALAPEGRIESGIQIEVIDPHDLEPVNFSGIDCVFLCNVPTPTEPQINALSRFVRGGGGLVIFAGDQMDDLDGYNRAMWLDGCGLLPARLIRMTAPVGRSEGVGLTRTGEHPVTAMFGAAGDSLSEYVHFRRFFECEAPAEDLVAQPPSAVQTDAGGSTQPRAAVLPVETSAAVVLARYADQNGLPAIVEKSFGGGRVLLFTSTCDLDWNDWARSPDGSYVVTLLETVHYAARRDGHPSAIVAGQPLLVSLSPELYESRATFKPPDYPDQAATDVTPADGETPPNERMTLTGPPALVPGSYTVELTRRTGEPETRTLCVNVDPRESNLTVATRADLVAALGDLRHEFIELSAGFLDENARTRHELWSSLLAAVVVVLLLEQLLAWWFGYGGLRSAKRTARPASSGALAGAAPR